MAAVSLSINFFYFDQLPCHSVGKCYVGQWPVASTAQGCFSFSVVYMGKHFLWVPKRFGTNQWAVRSFGRGVALWLGPNGLIPGPTWNVLMLLSVLERKKDWTVLRLISMTYFKQSSPTHVLSGHHSLWFPSFPGFDYNLKLFPVSCLVHHLCPTFMMLRTTKSVLFTVVSPSQCLAHSRPPINICFTPELLQNEDGSGSPEDWAG